MDLVDIEKRAFLFALKAIYFDQGGIWSSALDYYVAAGEALLSAADRGSRIPDLKRKARLYCDRAEWLRRSLDERAERQRRLEAIGSDWDTLEDAEERRDVDIENRATFIDDCAIATPETDDADRALSPGDELLHDYVVIYNSAVNRRRRSLEDNDAAAARDARGMALLTRRLFASALEADAAGNVEDAFLLYMRAVEETISEQKRDAKENDVRLKSSKEREVDKKVRLLASQAIERIEIVKEEITRRARR